MGGVGETGGEGGVGETGAPGLEGEGEGEEDGDD